MRDGYKFTIAPLALSLATLGLALSLALCFGCTKGLSSGNGDGASSADGLPTLKLSAVAPTTADAVSNLEVAVVRGEGGFDVSVSAGPEIGKLSDLYFALDYPADETHSLGLPSAPEALSDNAIGLIVESAPGHVVYGLAATKLSTTPVVKPGDTLLSFKLVNGAAPRAASEVATSGRARARNLELTLADSGNWDLAWDYTNPGDADQNGEVGINDLTPLGLHFLEKVSNTWDDPLRNVDGNSDGEINAGDITPIGQNFAAEIWAYQIEMSEDGSSNFRVIGQLRLDDNDMAPGETRRFSYSFGPEYVENAWYRVVPLDSNLEFGIPSEAISELGRRIDPIPVDEGREVTVTIYANDLPAAIAHLNAVRVVFPSSFEYVKNSANPGKTGGTTGDLDGIWESFVKPDGLLFPPDSFIVMSDLGDGKSALDLNVTTTERLLPGAPVGFGDLINFKLKNNGSAPLTLDFQTESADGIKRTYFSDVDNADHWFGNSIGFRVI